VLAFQAVRETDRSPDPSVAFASRAIDVAAGDVLEYDLYPGVLRAERGGIEVVFDDGSTIAPPEAPANPGWMHERVPLGAHSGSRIASLRLVARNSSVGASVFYVDDVVIRREKGAPIVVFDGTRDRTWHAENGAACFTVQRAPSYPASFVPAGSIVPGDPWGLVDLAVFRRGIASPADARASGESSHATSVEDRSSVSASSGVAAKTSVSVSSSDSPASESRAIDASAKLVVLDREPVGVKFLGAGIPFRFAEAGEPLSISAAGQHVGLGGVEGGRYYDLHLAVRIDADAPIDTVWQLFGLKSSSRPLAIRFARHARETDAANRALELVTVPVAADFEIESLRLPDDPRLHVYAMSLRWRKDAPADARFRRDWLVRETRNGELERYFREVDIGPAFTTLAGSSVLDHENEHEHQLFELALRRDHAAFERLLADRLAVFEDESPKFKRDRLAFVGRASSGASVSWSDAAASCVQDLERAIDAARAAPEVRWVAPSMQAIEFLRDHAPAKLAELRAAANDGRVELLRGAWSGEEPRGGSEAMARDLLLAHEVDVLGADSLGDRALGVDGRATERGAAEGRAVEAHGAAYPAPTSASESSGEAPPSWACLPRDLAYASQLPQLCRSAGVRALFGAAPYADRPPAFAWSAPDGSSVVALSSSSRALDEEPNELVADHLAMRLERARGEDDARAELFVPFDLCGDARVEKDKLREELDAIERLSSAELAPSVVIETPSDRLERIDDGDDPPLRAWDAVREMKQRSHEPLRPSRARAASRRAEAALERAECYAALAHGDGLAVPCEVFADLWKRLLWNQRFVPTNASDAAVAESEAKRIVDRAEHLSRSELEVLVRSADTRGPGQALAVYNPLAWERSAPIEIPDADVSVLDADLHPVPSQRTWSGTRVFLAELPSLGRSMFHLVKAADAQPSTPVATSEREGANVRGASTRESAPSGARTANDPRETNGKHNKSGEQATHGEGTTSADEACTISNGRLIVALDPRTGRIRSLRLGAVTEWLARNGIGGNVPLLFTDESARTATIIDAVDSIRVIERGPVRSVARIERTIGGARVVQDLVLYANRPELEIETHVDGTLGGARLCSAFEIKQVSPWVVHGVPFGATARPCAASELASPIRALDWIAQSTAHSCFTLCDDAGATFGAGARTLSLTLDDSFEGDAPAERTMRCKVCVGTESWRVRSAHAAAELEHPPQVLRVESHEGTRSARYSFLHLARVFPNGHAIEGPRSGLMLTAYKVAEDGDGCVLRVYESKGQSGTVRLTFDRPVFSARRVDVLERACGDVRIDDCTVELAIEPYRIESVRVAHRAR